MTDKVTVAVRIRPLLENEDTSSVCVTPVDPQRVCVGSKRMFSVDAVLNVADSTEHLFETHVKPLVDMFTEGYNATVLAYGQTGTGKTYTMSGISPLVMQYLHQKLESVEHLSFQHVEVYGEVIRDLFAQDGDITKPLQMLDGAGSKGTHVVGACRVRVRNLADAKLLFDHGSRMRTTGATNMNNTSSRSHSILTIFNPQKLSKLHLVDLAGSERNKKTGNVGVRFKESIGINSGLLALGNVIRALAQPQNQQQQHVPYRASKLTRLLQDSLGGNSKTLFVACIAPDVANLDETVRTLQYSCKAMHILNEPVANMDALVAQQQRHLQRLQNAHNLSSEEALRHHHAVADAFAAEQAAEIQRLTSLVSELERELREQKVELKKDEVVFAKQLKAYRAVVTENKRLRGALEKALATSPQPATEKSDIDLGHTRVTDDSLIEDCRKLEAELKVTEERRVRRANTTPATTRGAGAGATSRGKTHAKPLQLHGDAFESFISETRDLAHKLAADDEVLSPLDDGRPQTMATPPRVATEVCLFCDDARDSLQISSIGATPGQVQQHASLQEALKESLYYFNTNLKLRDQLQATLSENDLLARDNTVLKAELRQIQEILEQS